VSGQEATVDERATVAGAGESPLDLDREGWPAAAGVCAGLSAEALLGVLRAVFPPEVRSCHWGARADAISPILAGLPTDLAIWSEGRAWSRQAELRWQTDDAEHFSTLYLGDGDALPADFDAVGGVVRAVPSQPDGSTYLWGTRGPDGRYRDLRLGHALDYSGLGGDQAAARVPYRLLLSASGEVRFVRWALEETD
jgi:hypothetical protein